MTPRTACSTPLGAVDRQRWRPLAGIGSHRRSRAAAPDAVRSQRRRAAGRRALPRAARRPARPQRRHRGPRRLHDLAGLLDRHRSHQPSVADRRGRPRRSRRLVSRTACSPAVPRPLTNQKLYLVPPADVVAAGALVADADRLGRRARPASRTGAAGTLCTAAPADEPDADRATRLCSGAGARRRRLGRPHDPLRRRRSAAVRSPSRSGSARPGTYWAGSSWRARSPRRHYLYVHVADSRSCPSDLPPLGVRRTAAGPAAYRGGHG